MRILHTSDWHLGRTFGDFRLLDEQAAFIDWLVEVVAADGVDLVAIAGDLYDRSIPPVEAVTLFSDAVRRIRRAGAEVVAIAGNHDSGERIAAFDGLVDAGGVFIRGGYGAAATVTIRSYDDGPLAIVATPFLEPLLAPDAVRTELIDRAGDGAPPRLSHEAVLGHALERARAEIPSGMRSLVLSHAFVTGAAPSASERELAVGDSGMVSADLFDGFSYGALGHLHRPQRVAGRDHLRYSGSPLRYSFGERHDKIVVMVDLDAEGRVTTEERTVPVGRAVSTVRGRFDELVASPPETEAWVRVELTDAIVIPDAHRRLRSVFPWLVEIARVGVLDAPDPRLSAAELEVRSPAVLARSFWSEVADEQASERVGSILDDAVDAATRAAALDPEVA